MKKIVSILITGLLLALGTPARAQEGKEVIIVDGVSVLLLNLDEYLEEGDFGTADFVLPGGLLTIGEGAFEGIGARRVEVTTHVGSIGARAFADCHDLTAILIPSSVVMIDDTAFDGCENVTVFGETSSVAQSFADSNGIPFVSLQNDEEWESYEDEMDSPIILRFIPFS